jgi:hypothetical protein
MSFSCRLLGLITVAMSVLASPAWAQRPWYIHAELGDDANSGLAPEAPFRTLARWRQSFTNLETLAGDEVLMSGTFRESLVINMLGPKAPQPLTFRQWTSGDSNPRNLLLSQAVLRGDKPVRGWERQGATNRYQAQLSEFTGIVSVVWNWDSMVDRAGRNLAHLVRVGSSAEVEITPYSWCHSGLTLDVNVTPPEIDYPIDPDAGVCAYVPYGGNGGLTVQWGDGVAFRDLHAYLWLNDITGSYGFSQENARGARIINCVTRDTSHHGIGFTGATRENNSIEDCQVRGLMGLRNDKAADAYGYLSNGTDLVGGRIVRCVAYCYSLMTPSGQPLNADRRIHGLRCGTTSAPGSYVRGLDVVDFTVHSDFPSCGQFSSPVRVLNAFPPSDLSDPATYAVRFTRLSVRRGGYMNVSGPDFNAAFIDSTLDFSDNSRRGLEGYGAVAAAFGQGGSNRVLFKNCRIRAVVDNRQGRFWSGSVFTVQSGMNLRLEGCRVEEVGFRPQGSTGVMFGWYNAGGTVRTRDTTFTYVNPFSVRTLCKGDRSVLPAQRDFDRCRYVNLSPGLVYTDWFGPDYALPDIRDAAGWFANEPGDPNGTGSESGPPSVSGSTVRSGFRENSDDRPR